MNRNFISSGMTVALAEEYDHIFFGAKCLFEIKRRHKLSDLDNDILSQLKYIALKEHDLAYSYRYGFVSQLAVIMIAENWGEYEGILPWLKSLILSDASSSSRARAMALKKVVENWKEDPEVLTIVKRCIEIDISDLQRIALLSLAEGWSDSPGTLNLLKESAQSDKSSYSTRGLIIEKIAEVWAGESWLCEFLHDRAINDPFVREPFLSLPDDLVLNPRFRSLRALIIQYQQNRRSMDLLKERAVNDPDSLLREWAKHRLKELGDQ